MAVRVHFDLYTRDDDRWMLHGNFPGSEHARALNAAQDLDATGDHAGTQVVRVTRFAETRPPVETVEWITPSLADLAPRDPRRRRNRPSLPTAHEPPETPRPAAADYETPETPAFPRQSGRAKPTATAPPVAAPTILAAITIGSAAAVAVFYTARNAVIELSNTGHALAAGLSAIVAISASIIAFVLVAATIAHLLRPRRTAADGSVPPPPGSARLDDGHRRTMLRFIERLLTTLSTSGVPMRDKTQFGINLLVAGGGEHYASMIGLGGFDRYVLIHDSLQALGLEADVADRFCQRFYQFDSDPAHRPITNAGRNLFDGFLRGKDETFRGLPSLIDDWISAAT